MHNYYANDVFPEVVNENKKQKMVKWSTEDYNHTTSYPSSFFDVIIAGEVIEHVYNTDNFLEEIYRTLKPKGYLIISTPNLASWWDRIYLLFGLQPHSTEVSSKSRVFGREIIYKIHHTENEEVPGHLRVFTKEALKSMLRYYKFKIVKDIPTHVHNFAINRWITRFLPPFSQNTLLVAQK